MSDSPRPGHRGRLIVTRNIGESILINNEIEVRLDEIESRRARLVVMAPLDVTVRRCETKGSRKRSER